MQSLFILKGCVKCKGDLSLDVDMYMKIHEWVCVNCGYRFDAKLSEIQLKQLPPTHP